MDTASKPTLFKAWYNDLKNFDTRIAVPKRKLLPHLRVGASLVTVFVSSYFGIYVADAITIIIVYGPHAFFREGLRIVDRHGLLSNGMQVSFAGRLIEFPMGLLVWVALICSADFCSMIIQRIIRKKGRRADMAFRLVGGPALVVFATSLYRQGFPWLHPIPLSALIGGVVLTLKAFRVNFQETDSNRTAP